MDFQHLAQFIVDRREDFVVARVRQVQIVVHDVVRDGLVVADDVLVYRHHVHVFGHLVDVRLVAELVDQERVHVVVALPVRVGEVAPG